MKPTKISAGWEKKLLPLAAALILTGVRFASAATYPATILADNPVAYWRLEDTNGSSTVVDSSATGTNIGYVTYVTQADGVTVYPQLGVPAIYTNGAAFALSSGAGQGRIEVPVNSFINPSPDGTNGAPFSAELWAMATTQPGNFAVPLDDSSDFGQPAPFNNSAGWNIYQTVGPASTWSFSIRPHGFVGNGPSVVIGQWTHLILTYDGANARFYVNGVLFGTFAIPAGGYLVNNGAENLVFASGPATGFIPFSGELDEIALYNYALSLSQVTNHYQVGTNSITPTATPPSFTLLPPASTNAYSGVPFTFSSQAVGTAPLHYQWVRGGTAPIGPIANATNNNYTFTPIYPDDNNATFSVTVTNSAGSTNSPATTLTVLTNINDLHDPFSITRREGGYAAFRTVANGAEPISFQWHSVSNSVDTVIPGGTSDTLWLSNIQASISGNMYYAVMTNPFETITGNTATLTVVARTTNAPVTLYDKIVMADSPVGYWRLDESNGTPTGSIALDTAGSFDGTYTYMGSDLTLGYPTGIPHEIDPAIHVTNTAIVTIPYALELNPVTGPWSVEFWLQPTSQDTNNFRTPISSEANPNAGANLTGWNIYQHIQSYWTWNIFNGGSGGSFTSEFVDHPVVPGQWYHMVLTDDGANMVWYVNDRQVFSIGVGAVGFVQNGLNGDPAVAGGPLTLAVRSDGVFGGWDGGIDELAVYNYVLNPQQIQNHFLNSTHLNIAASGGKVVVTWPVGTLQVSTNISGTYTNVTGATSPYTNSAAPALFYRAQLQ
jgi:hypothetical protein